MEKGLVLIVENEFLVRSFASEIAEGAGFSVLDACDADAGIRILESRSDISVVMTDVDMPGSMDGLELACSVHHRWPTIDIIVTSGKFEPHQDEMPDGGHFLPKPYSPGGLGGLLSCFAGDGARRAFDFGEMEDLVWPRSVAGG